MTIYIVDLEAVETRYTAEWKEHLPKQMQKFFGKSVDVVTISGGDVPQTTTPGAFLNFAGTNNYKSQQMLQISQLFAEGKVKDGDYFLYTDAWNPTVIQLRYMAELLGVNIRIGGMWHAGSYDPADFLGRLIGGKPWVRYAEASMFECYNHNFFATRFHVNLFADTFLEGENLKLSMAQGQVIICGWPMEYEKKQLKKPLKKKDMVVFPHRIAPEKQPELVKAIAEKMPEIEFCFCQEHDFTKEEYHNVLRSAKCVFSANLQETLGISPYEGALVGAIPLVPDRLSYKEMYTDAFKYPSEWSENLETANIDALCDKIKDVINNYDKYANKLLDLKLDNFFSGDKLYTVIGRNLG